MNAVTATRRTIRREWTAFGALLIISVGMMGISDTQTAHDLQSIATTIANPAETVVNSLADTVGSYWSALTQIDRLRTQNELLKQQNLTLQEQLDRMPGIGRLNDDWTKITAAAAGLPYQTTPVRVIVRDTATVQKKTLIINKGSNDGLTTGEVVVDAGGALVGRISITATTESTILLINDPSSVVVGKESKSNATGTIRGSISGALLMSYVDVNATLTKDEPVVTAGEALPGTSDVSPFPPGLLIGKIQSVSTDPNAVVQSAIITASAHLTDATFLLVITDYKGGFGALPSGCVGNPTPSGSPSPTPRPGSPAVPSASASAGVCPPGTSQWQPTPSPSPGPSLPTLAPQGG
ncbi:MAG TPA: rod shape-determining protein MreC [Candidatus Limnocylindrales bacterium]